MKTAAEVNAWFRQLYAEGALYVWGMNGDVISDATISTTCKTFCSTAYPKSYYDAKLAAGRGKHGADCSGAMCPMSGYDATADGYYNACSVKGAISGIDTSKPCLVFKANVAGSKYHIGWYCGDGYVIEMQSSKTNCVKALWNKGGWTHYGIPKWVSYDGYEPSEEADDEPDDEAIAVSAKELSRGSVSPAVKKMQILLLGLGYELPKYKDDGDFGAETETALKKYQAANGLTADGVCGVYTWESLLN